MATKYHAEHVGSLLRPSWLLDARAAHKQGTLDSEALREAEDRAALQAIELQRDAGIEVFTDGEMRRDTWMAGLLRVHRGSDAGRHAAGAVAPGGRRPAGRGHRLRQRGGHRQGVPPGSRTSAEASFLAEHAPGQFKITMISSSMGGMLWHPGLSDGRLPVDPATWSATWSRCKSRRSRA